MKKLNLCAPPPAIILGLGVNGLGIARSLSEQGINSIGLYHNRNEIGRLSRHCSIVFRCPDINESQESFLDFLIHTGSQFGTKCVLFAESDDYVLFISRNRERLTDHFLFALPHKHILEKIINKTTFYRMCESKAIPSPKTYNFTSLEELEGISRQMQYPCILKPSYTSICQTTLGQKAIALHSREHLFEVCKGLNGLFEYILIQELIRGDADQIYFCGAYIGLDGKAKAISLGRKIRQYPPAFGVTSLAESINNEFLMDLSVSTLRKLDVKGLCDLEFKRDTKDNKFKIIEINLRTGLWHGLCRGAGVNLCAIAFKDLIGEKTTELVRNQKRTKWIHEEFDLGSSYKHFKEGKLSFRKWIGSLKGVRIFAIFQKDDPIPALISYSMLIKHFLGTLFSYVKGALSVC